MYWYFLSSIVLVFFLMALPLSGSLCVSFSLFFFFFAPLEVICDLRGVGSIGLRDSTHVL